MTRFNSLRLVAVGAALSAVLAAPAFAADTQNLAVSASVPGICKLTTTDVMSFTLDPSGSANGSATSNWAYKCTKNTAPLEVKVNGASAPSTTFNLAGTGANSGTTIPVTVSWTNPSTAGNGFGGAAIPFSLGGSILNADFINVPADTYSKTVAVVINN